ncbi:MAG: hypothetical protein CM15mP46_0260 [Alphaproteobacteria bacterium]|nr:MAG: hypothetical protein CM15mP46_0260 [Alphaproteobacteria bacterium]
MVVNNPAEVKRTEKIGTHYPDFASHLITRDSDAIPPFGRNKGYFCKPSLAMEGAGLRFPQMIKN